MRPRSGILNPIEEISEAAYAGRAQAADRFHERLRRHAAGVGEIRYEAMVSSANKCIEGVPGFGFVIAARPN